LLRYLAPPSQCGYLPDRDASLEYELVVDLTAAEYAERMLAGWRRFGRALFRPRCQGCRECQPIRVPVERFRPDRSQRRVRRANEGVVQLRIRAPSVSPAKLALYDRYHNIRGPEEARHDREEAQTHAADIVAIIKARPDLTEFKTQFEGQFVAYSDLGKRVNAILSDFFRDVNAPGYLLYEEHLAATLPAGRATQAEIREESARAHRILQRVLPEPNLPDQ